ncbi:MULTISPECIES: hypothetical protein [Vibrio]|uniref:hypothetical protein n=1 Tax=Vibrio TaxID=662 RepID=UPI001268D96E|nr:MULTISPECIES: hypothetical protein [Vibrio]MCM5509747.1 hypothetical protein [Vibrio sp. SCSIO 43169]NOI28194.1 hypothetical protein [Vibrio coralliilyticus]NOI49135.1 hypothetical protein [Vibrio coralliilyticus]QFT35991.1 hypothetical protein FIU99_06085 [Vibrio sp. THAF64]QGM33891.1 hypothetical protein GGC04_06095 [Vibrio sp. THAF191d]
MKKILLATLLASVSSFAFATATDYGEISKLYTNNQGHIAIQLNRGFPKADELNTCSNHSGWAGLHSPDPTIKELLVAAKSSNQDITIVTNGCEGDWLKIYSLVVE